MTHAPTRTRIRAQHLLAVFLCIPQISRAHIHMAPEAYGAMDMPVQTTSPIYSCKLWATALILKPGGSNTHFAAEALPLPLASPNWQIFDIHAGYRPGFDIGVAGFFHSVDSMLRSNWEHFNSTSRAAVTVAPEDMIGPFFEIGPDATPYSSACGKIAYNFDEFNIEYGQMLNVGRRLSATPFAGITFVQIKQKATTTYANTDDTITRTITVPTTFGGGGLRVGIDYAYRLVHGFQLNGKTVASLFGGAISNKTTYNSASPAVDPNIQQTAACHRDLVVPAFGQWLGAEYEFLWNNHYEVSIQAGFQIQVYLQALQTNDIGSEVITPPVVPDAIGVYARTFQRTVSNFSLSGAYVSFTFGF